jgi:hypothetical protein
MPANRQNQSDLLRKVYLPYMRVQFNLKSILLQRLMRNTEQYSEGEELSLPLHVGQSGGWGWNSAGKLPAASHQKVKRHKYNYHRMYGRIEIDGPHVEGAKKSYAAERRPYDFETKNLIKQMRHGLNHDLFGSGSGSVASVGSGGGPRRPRAGRRDAYRRTGHRNRGGQRGGEQRRDPLQLEDRGGHPQGWRGLRRLRRREREPRQLHRVPRGLAQ